MRALCFLALIACQPRTEILLGVATDMRAPTGIDEVQLEVGVAGTGVPQQTVSWPIPGIPNRQFTLPGSYGIVSEDGTVGIDVALIGLKGGNPVVRRTAKLTLVDGQTLFYRMGLTQSCAGNGVVCTDGQTCVEGRCEDPDINPDQMPDYDPNLVTTLTCEGLVTYINTANGAPMPFSEDAAECPYVLCAEGTCLDLPPGARLFRGVCGAVSSFALIINGETAQASIGFFRGLNGTATANEFSVPVLISNGASTDIVNFTGTFSGDPEDPNVVGRAYGIGIYSKTGQGSLRCDAYSGTPQRYCGTFTRTTTPMIGMPPMPGTPVTTMGRVAFVRGATELFGQYASELPAIPNITGSFDGWPTGSTMTGETFNMFWRNEAFLGVPVESGTANATLDGVKLTGSWAGMTGNAKIEGSFEADPSRCRATSLPMCGGACTGTEACIKGTCVGTGLLRFTLEWDTATDIDLHVRTPSGAELSWMVRAGDSGTLDVDDQGEGHLVENIFFTAPAAGMYQVWAHNYDGDTATTFTIRVATPSTTVSTFTGMLGATHEESMRFTYLR